METPVSENDLLKIQQVAERWGVSSRTVMRIIERKELPSILIGRQRRLRPCDVLAYEQTKKS